MWLVEDPLNENSPSRAHQPVYLSARKEAPTSGTKDVIAHSTRHWQEQQTKHSTITLLGLQMLYILTIVEAVPLRKD